MACSWAFVWIWRKQAQQDAQAQPSEVGGGVSSRFAPRVSPTASFSETPSRLPRPAAPELALGRADVRGCGGGHESTYGRPNWLWVEREPLHIAQLFEFEVSQFENIAVWSGTLLSSFAGKHS